MTQPSTLVEQIQDFLGQSPESYNDISVSVADGTITITETVDEWGEEAFVDSLIATTFRDFDYSQDSGSADWLGICTELCEPAHTSFVVRLPLDEVRKALSQCPYCAGNVSYEDDGICTGCASYPPDVSYTCQCREPHTATCHTCEWMIKKVPA